MKTFFFLLLVLSSFNYSSFNYSSFNEIRFIDDRDQNEYNFTEINGLKWMTENLRFETETSLCVNEESDLCESCGQFYLVEDALKSCPNGWRLPTEVEMKAMMKLNKKKKLNLVQDLHIDMCGRIDGAVHAKYGQQNTFWLDAPLEDGFITHWHTFGEKHELHSHNVVNAKRQFPVRCVCEL